MHVPAGVVCTPPKPREKRLPGRPDEVAARARAPDEGPELAELRLLATLTAEMHDAVLLVDPAGRIRVWTGGAERILGWSAAEARGRDADALLRPEAADAAAPGEREAALEQGRACRCRERVLRRDGTRIPLEVLRVPHEGSGEAPGRHVLVLARELPDEAAAGRSAASAGEERARRADPGARPFESAGLGHWLWDLASGALSYDRRWPERLGYGAEEIPPQIQAWEALADPDGAARMRAEIEAHLRGETDGIDCEFRLRGKDGRWRWIHSRGRIAVRDASGRPLQLMGTHADVTRRREPEERVRAALAANQRLVAELREALARVKTLSGLLPVCAWCKKIRDDAGYWQRIETYLSEHSAATFTHAMCPECQAREFGVDDDDP